MQRLELNQTSAAGRFGRRSAQAAAVLLAAGLLAGCPPRIAPTPPRTLGPQALGPAPVLGTPPHLPFLLPPELPPPGARAQLTLAEIKPLADAAVPALPAPAAEAPATSAPSTSAPAATHPEPPPQAIKDYLQGREKYREGDLNAAATFLEQALQLDPHSFDVLKLLGQVNYARRQPQPAADYLRQAAALRPHNVEINYLLGRLYFDSGNDLASVAFFIRATESPLRDDYQVLTPLAALHLARSLQQVGCYAAAAHSLERFLDLAGREIPSYHYDRDLTFVLDELWAVHLAAAEDFARAGAFSAAVPHYRAALMHNPEDPYILSRLAAAEAVGGFSAAARARALDLVHQLRGSAPAINLLIWVYQQTGLAPAAALSAELEAAHPRPGVRLALAGIEEDAGHTSVAARLLADYLNKNPDDQTVLLRLMTWGRRDHQLAPAFTALIRAVAHAPADAGALTPQLAALLGPQPAPTVLPELTAITVPAAQQWARQYLLASVAQSVRQPARAAAHYEAALEARPDFFAARQNYVYLLLSQGAYDRATAAVQQALDAGSSAQILNLQITLQRTKQQYSLALKTAARALDLYPDDEELMRAVANIYIDRDQPAEAERQLRRIISQFPEDESAYEALLRFALSAGDARSLAEGLSLTLQVWPQNRLALRISAELLTVRGETLRGIALLGRLVAQDPSDVPMQQALAAVQSQNDQLPAAILTLEKATRGDPPPAPLVAQLARYYVRAGRQNDAAALVQRVCQAHPDDPDYAVVEADTLLELRRPTDAERVYHQAVAQFPDSAIVAAALLNWYRDGANRTAALATYQAYIARTAPSVDRLYNLAHLQDEAGQRAAAAATLQRVLKILPSHVGAANDLAYYYSEMNEHLDEAQQLISQALDNVPGSAAFIDTQGWVYYKRGDMEQALRMLRRANALTHAQDPDVLRHLADALYRTGNTQEALTTWRRALSQLPKESQNQAENQPTRDYLEKVIADVTAQKPASVTPTAAEAAKH